MSLFQELQQRRARVLFVCLGNSSRSQMAEALAQSVAADVLEAHSAGIEPAAQVSRRAVAALAEKGIALGFDRMPKSISSVDLSSFDVIVNLCEYRFPKEERIPSRTVVLKMPVFDPMGQGEQAYREALEEVEKIVEFLGEHFRRARDWNPVGVSAEDAPRTTSGPPPLPRPLKAAAKAASI
jgi:protein-tyrosine-phosphatase